ncbi:hypothetical protein, partial [Mycobacterium tuberculosis]
IDGGLLLGNALGFRAAPSTEH